MNRIPGRRPTALAAITILATSGTALAVTVAEKNQARNPPAIAGAPDVCKITLAFKPALLEGIDDMHGYLVVTRPDGSKLELRGGPTHKGPSSPGSLGPVGNPFNCATPTEWGVVVPYIGPHGKLGTDAAGAAVFSPDGNVSAPSGATAITGSADGKKTCAIAGCLMQVMQAAGKSCLPYTVGTGELRNSNTIISFALASCGVKNPLPAGIQATGWGGSWNKP